MTTEYEELIYLWALRLISVALIPIVVFAFVGIYSVIFIEIRNWFRGRP
jgi:hypothetical protein